MGEGVRREDRSQAGTTEPNPTRCAVCARCPGRCELMIQRSGSFRSRSFKVRWVLPFMARNGGGGERDWDWDELGILTLQLSSVSLQYDQGLVIACF